jgi:hypothetical protein
LIISVGIIDDVFVEIVRYCFGHIGKLSQKPQTASNADVEAQLLGKTP